MNTELDFHDPLYMAKYAESLYNRPIAKSKRQRNRNQDDDSDDEYASLPFMEKQDKKNKLTTRK